MHIIKIMKTALGMFLLRKLLFATFTSYSPTGPFTDNTTPPSLSAQYNNNIETFLQQIVAPLVTDNTVTSDGSGNIHVFSVHFFKGIVTRINFGFTSFSTSGTTVNHGLAATPACILAMPSGVSTTIYAGGANSTSFTVTVGANCNGWWLAIA